jgi:hypothetical protein
LYLDLKKFAMLLSTLQTGSFAATPAFWLFAKNTHRVFLNAQPSTGQFLNAWSWLVPRLCPIWIFYASLPACRQAGIHSPTQTPFITGPLAVSIPGQIFYYL